MALLLAQMTSSEWGILAGVIVAIALPSFGCWVTVLVKLNSLEQGQKFYTQTLERVVSENQNIWSQIGKHEQRIDSHDSLIGKIIDKLQIPKDATKNP